MRQNEAAGGHGRGATKDDPRRVAFDVLRAVSRDNAYANLVLPRLLSHRGLNTRDAAFATELGYGTLRMRGTLDDIIQVAARRDMSRIDGAVADVLRLGVYQLLCTKVAVHAAVDTSVSLARSACGHKPAGFVNAVLRKISQRSSGQWLDSLVTGDEMADIAREYAHPQWIVRSVFESLPDPDEAVDALAANNVAPHVQLCARPGKITQTQLCDQVNGSPGRWSSHAVTMASGDPADVQAVKDGHAHVQDEGSQLVAEALANAEISGPDAVWLDLCAGPGGKTAMLGALAAQRDAHVTAVEVTAHRAKLVAQATAGLPVTVHCDDGRRFSAENGFDRVLVDVPCSGIGALRRRPEARWRREETDLLDLTALQGQLLAAAVQLARPGGVIAYVTCSSDLRETRDICAQVAGVQMLDTRECFPRDMPDLGNGPMVQLWPHLHGVDAMFCALMQRQDVP